MKSVYSLWRQKQLYNCNANYKEHFVVKLSEFIFLINFNNKQTLILPLIMFCIVKVYIFYEDNNNYTIVMQP